MPNILEPLGWREAGALLWSMPITLVHAHCFGPCPLLWSMPSPGKQVSSFLICPSPPLGLISVGKKRRSQRDLVPLQNMYAHLSFHLENLHLIPKMRSPGSRTIKIIQIQSSTPRSQMCALRASIGLCSLFSYNVYPQQWHNRSTSLYVVNI